MSATQDAANSADADLRGGPGILAPPPPPPDAVAAKALAPLLRALDDDDHTHTVADDRELAKMLAQVIRADADLRAVRTQVINYVHAASLLAERMTASAALFTALLQADDLRDRGRQGGGMGLGSERFEQDTTRTLHAAQRVTAEVVPNFEKRVLGGVLSAVDRPSIGRRTPRNMENAALRSYGAGAHCR